jgi:hypothetical protein
MRTVSKPFTADMQGTPEDAQAAESQAALRAESAIHSELICATQVEIFLDANFASACHLTAGSALITLDFSQAA